MSAGTPHRPHPRESMTFRSVSAAMLWIAEELIQSPPDDRRHEGRSERT